MTWLVPLALVLLTLLGMPLFAVIGAAALWAFHLAGVDLAVVLIEFYRIAEMPVLLAIPLFTLAGYLLSESGAPARLVALSQALLGWLPAGLALVALAASAFFTAFTGASGVTIVALGALLYPALRQDGYDESYSLGLVTTSGSLGLLFAPSLPLILYAIVVQQLNIAPAVSVEALFRAGILPGLLMLALLGGWSIWRERHRRTPLTFDAARLRRALRAALWELPLPLVVLGGIYSGYFAVSEAAAVTLAYVFVVEVLVLREIPLRRLAEICERALVLVGGILLILGLSLASTTALIDGGVPERLFTLVQSQVDSRLGFLLLLNLFLLLLGALLDIFSALVLVVPLILPVALGYGVDPVHLGIIFLANMQIGYLTPPVGMNLFIASYRFKRPVVALYRASWPFLLLLLLSLLLITYVPLLSLGLL
ncbi:TRAP transporter large permease [Desulfuromonas thiophila]|uniref:TRAP transporter, DctM subunit n=1 Tax=Desulfuromonas thiophila TaxID=57664 RepID=A0A1G7CC66_9BACT|nr:TRAP transporter large permease subunit [Desulfuromonas thiophila]SDE36899.1 TRAP transporter, DctM subunit [Desulfuromonas thiophila]